MKPRSLRPAIKPHKIATGIKLRYLFEEFLEAAFEDRMLKGCVNTPWQEYGTMIGRHIFDSSEVLRQADFTALDTPRDSACAAFLIRGVGMRLLLPLCGLSSTGKSAILDIFDYCLGSSEFTPPKHGVIADYSSIYFTLINLERSSLLLGRTRDRRRAFLKEELEGSFELLEKITPDVFGDSYFLPINIFKKNLGRYFGLTMTNVDEDNQERACRHNQEKLPSPSVRSFSSFVLQQQNLIANKFALFYRFEEKEKKDQAIEHFKYFAGFVTPEYYTLKQREQELLSKQRSLKLGLKLAIERQNKVAEELKDLLKQYRAASGTELAVGNVHAILAAPQQALNRLLVAPIQTDGDSEEYRKLREAQERLLSSQVSQLRKLQNRLSDINVSMRLARNIYEGSDINILPKTLSLNNTKCPLCNNHMGELFESANKLSDAIDWLNRKLTQSHYMQDYLEEKK